MTFLHLLGCLVPTPYRKTVKSNYKRIKYGFYQFHNKIKAHKVRHKKVINVYFVICNLSMWKTEPLYLRMLKHPRFNPILRIAPLWGNVEAARSLEEYVKNKRYDYRFILGDAGLEVDGPKPDIIFYTQPYSGAYPQKTAYNSYSNVLICHVSYGIHNILNDYVCNSGLLNIAWQYYFENYSCAEDNALMMDNNGCNSYITGVPVFDLYRKTPEECTYPWKQKDPSIKRIIYAPHFSIEPDSILKYGTFLKNGECMLEMAKKYNGKVQFVFKPHPMLRLHLQRIWGEERTNAYYKEWENLENSKAEYGSYIELFMTSDALIHDCCTFTNEYMFAKKPALYLLHDACDRHIDNLNSFTKKAFNLHEMGYTHEDIERFIIEIINGKDNRLKEREVYFEKYLKPIDGDDANENIIASILGTKDFRFKPKKQSV